MPTIFISRDIPSGSFFRQGLEKKGYTIIDQSLIDHSPTPFPALPICDWLFFYSKNGVHFFLQQAEYQLLSNTRLATIGNGTAKSLVQHGYIPDFIGNGHPKMVATSFLEEARGQTVVFPQAKNSKQSVQQILGNEIDAIDLIVYENTPKTDFDLPDADILVFTSPLNVEAYFTKKKITAKQRILAIGNTTGAALWKQGLHDYAIAREPSEIALLEGVLQFK